VQVIISEILLFRNDFTDIVYAIMNIEPVKKAEYGRILGIDFGSKRVGIAVSDEARQFATPVSVIQNTSTLLVEVEKIAIDYETKLIVLGESRNYNGEPNAIFEDADNFKKALESKGFNVEMELEFMTSQQAERIQGKNELSDASAAALILQSYLDRTKKQND
jgi:putative Holliday junction resolvase